MAAIISISPPVPDADTIAALEKEKKEEKLIAADNAALNRYRKALCEFQERQMAELAEEKRRKDDQLAMLQQQSSEIKEIRENLAMTARRTNLALYDSPIIATEVGRMHVFITALKKLAEKVRAHVPVMAQPVEDLLAVAKEIVEQLRLEDKSNNYRLTHDRLAEFVKKQWKDSPVLLEDIMKGFYPSVTDADLPAGVVVGFQAADYADRKQDTNAMILRVSYINRISSKAVRELYGNKIKSQTVKRQRMDVDDATQRVLGSIGVTTVDEPMAVPTSHVNVNVGRGRGGPPEYGRGGHGGGRGAGRGNGVCWTCHGYGHRSDSCPSRGRGMSYA